MNIIGKSLLALTLALHLGQAGASSAAPADLYEGSPYAVETTDLGNGIYLIQRSPSPSWRSPVMANVTVVVTDDDVIVVDGGGLPQHSENVIAEIRKITDRPVTKLLNTHWHGDHNLGHGVFRREFPHMKLITHAENRDDMVTGVMDYAIVAEDYSPDERVKTLEENLLKLAETGVDESVLAFEGAKTRDFPGIIDQYRIAEWLPADETFDERYVMHSGGRTIEFLHLGRGNTDGDSIMWLPEEKIVVTGDLVVHPTPYGFGSYPGEWAETLAAIQALGYERLVPGHGDMQEDSTYVGNLIEVLRAIDREAEAAVADGVTELEDFRARFDWTPFDATFAGDGAILDYIFDIYFKQPILDAALKLEKGESVGVGDDARD